MILNLTTLDEGVREFGFQIHKNTYSQDSGIPEMLSPVRSTVRLIRTGNQVLITGRFIAVVNIICSRCLEYFQYSIESDYNCDFRPDNNKSDDDENIELTPNELDIIWYKNNELDLIEQIRQNILLNLPMRPLCNENCRGLCVQCGINLNYNNCGCKMEFDSNPFKKLSEWRST